MKSCKNQMNYWEKFIQGDSSALSNIYNCYIDDLFSYGMTIYPDEFIVKDAIQDIFIQLTEKRKQLNPEKNVKAYVFKSLRNKILEEVRTKTKRNNLERFIFNSDEQTECDVERQIIISEEEVSRQVIIQEAMDVLSKHQKEAIYLKFTINCPYKQIAEIMGITIPSVRTLVYRSLMQMKVYILQRISK